ncbi:MAG: DNA integrity scanning protein DisA nucleotide-binding domain protein [Rubrobacter sp.]|nr:DNA integrity scanning protein DisA nucleotide-binding domain protein [Rubrobacter sp.]
MKLSRAAMGYAYPYDLASFVRERWDGTVPGAAPLPDMPVLENLLSACYQASLLREEERSVTFRMVLCDPDRLPVRQGPPSGLHKLEFPEPRPFDVQELRRLSPAANYYRSLVGVAPYGEGGLRIWGLVHSGPRWLRWDQGGRDTPPPLPSAPIVRVSGPGRVAVDCGSVVVGKLEEGMLSDSTMNVYDSRWLPDTFAPVRAELAEIHSTARERAREKYGEVWAPLDNDVTRMIGQHTIKRVVSAVRNSRHGGTLVIVPPDLADDILEDRYVALKYKFAEDEPRRRFRTLIVRAMNVLAESYGRDGASTGQEVGWEAYEASGLGELSDLDEAIFEVAHLIAGLAAVDGAVVMTQRFELLGFGGEISGELPGVETVSKALDIEGDETMEEPTEGFGTRHRSAFRLCEALPDVIAVVISQDSNVRFVKHKDGAVTYWDQA